MYGKKSPFASFQLFLSFYAYFVSTPTQIEIESKFDGRVCESVCMCVPSSIGHVQCTLLFTQIMYLREYTTCIIHVYAYIFIFHTYSESIKCPVNVIHRYDL